MFNPDDIVVRERQSGNRQAGNVSGGGYGRNGSGAYGQRVEQTRGQYSGNAGQYGKRAQAAGTRRVEAGNTLSPKQAKKQQKKLKKQRRHKKFWFGFKIFMLIALIAILAALVVIYFKFGDDLLKWKMEATDVVENSTADTFRASETSIIYASNKSKLKGDKDSYYLSFDEIPQSVKDAMVVTEDRDFYKHEGVNFWSTAKAAVMLVESKLRHKDISRGGSTITQQLAKNVFLSNERTYERKVREIFIALDLEKKYTKDQILEFYINNIYFANGYYGIEAASRGYFNKPAKDLDLAEAVFLCSIPNRPSFYNPLEHYQNTLKRKNRILKQMLDEDCISAAEYSDANYEKIVLKPAQAIKTQNYMTTYAVSCATKALMKARGFEFKYKFKNDEEKKQYDKEYDKLYDECHNSLYTGGYRIYTSLNKKKQKKLQKAVNDQLAGFKEKTKNTNKNEIAEMMVGRKLEADSMINVNRQFKDDYILEVKNFRVNMPGEKTKDVSFKVRRGEIFGIGGLAGHGKTSISNGIFGMYPSSGSVLYNGEELNYKKTGEALNKGMAFVSEDRKGVGLLLDESIAMNMVYTDMKVNRNFLKKFGFFSQFDEKTSDEKAEEMIKELYIRCTGPDQIVGRLSGGNQQKVCMARALLSKPKLLFVSEPTRGIDIGAKQVLLNYLVKINKELGITIVMTSSELNELRSVCDRIAIIGQGTVQGILKPDSPNVDFALLMSGEGGENHD